MSSSTLHRAAGFERLRDARPAGTTSATGTVSLARVYQLSAPSYSGEVEGRLVRLPDGAPVGAEQQALHAAFAAHVDEAAFPCLGAKAAHHAKTIRFGSYGDLASPEATPAFARDLRSFVTDGSLRGDFTSFAAVFAASDDDEAGFERKLWQQLQRLNELDRRTSRWDPTVSDDPADPRFSFSFAGTALFVVGLHANASRISRRFERPTLVFNPQRQFERLRERGKWATFTGAIRGRDVALQGSINPNLSDHGERSDARQYSGRAVEATWACPFRH